jgi:signal transduction histidine kinase
VSDTSNPWPARYERLRLLYEVSNVIHSTLDPAEALQLILREAVRLMRASSGSVVLLNPTNGLLEIEAAHGLTPDATRLKLRRGEGITGRVAQTGKPLRVGDVSADPHYVPVRPGVRSELAVPLAVGGEVRGVLNVDSDRPEAFSADDLELLEELAVQAAKVIHHTWLYEQLRLKARRFESLVNIARTISSTLSLDEALTVITHEACLLMEAQLGAVLLLDDTREWLDLRACHGAGPAYRAKPRLSVAESLLGSVVRRRKPVQVSDVQTSARYQHPEIARQEGLVSLLSVPLVFGDQAIGTLSIYTGQLHVFSDEEVLLLSALGNLSAIALEKARLYERFVDVEEQLREHEKLAALGLLAAEVAHEIRNPLTVMKMLYHSLDLQFAPDDPRSRDAQIMGEKMEHLNRIVERILDFARTTEPAMQWVQVNELVEELGLLTRHKLAQHRVQLARHLAPDLPAVRGDTAQLRQVFLNLVLNAVAAMPDGGVLTLTTRCGTPGPEAAGPARVIIEFQDTGLGMTPEQRSKAFQAFWSGGKRAGTGLGLAIVARILEAHHGSVELDSQPGRGTTVRLMLPV